MSETFDPNDRKEPKDGTTDEAKRYAHGSDQIAEACVAAIFGKQGTKVNIRNKNGFEIGKMFRREAKERIAATLDAINETRHEAGSRSS